MLKNPWKTIKRITLYENKYGYKLREDDVITPGGTNGKYMVLEGKGYVAIVALTKNNQLALVRQWRYPIEEESLEIPAGTIAQEEDPLQTAKRELAEEVGGVSNEWVDLGSHWLGNGALKIKGYVYLALNVKLANNINSQEDEKLSVELIDFSVVLQKAKKGCFSDARTQLGVLLAKQYLDDHKLYKLQRHN